MLVRLVVSSPDLSGRPAEVLPEFAFIGRSNCGKSSLINHVLERAKLAHTSNKPGKTRLLNYYLVEDRFYLVDLPGYGYAKVSKEQRAHWRRIFQAYLSCQERPLAVLHLLDVRRTPSAEDCEVSGWIAAGGHPFALAVTKIDKVGTNGRAARYRDIIAALGVPPETPFFPTSAAEHSGRREILGWVDALLAANQA